MRLSASGDFKTSDRVPRFNAGLHVFILTNYCVHQGLKVPNPPQYEADKSKLKLGPHAKPLSRKEF